jgi:hypothetical protein
LNNLGGDLLTSLNDRYTIEAANTRFALKTDVASGGNFTTGSIGGSFSTITTNSAITGGSLVTGAITIGSSKIGYTGNADLVTLSSSGVIVDGLIQATTLKIGTTDVSTELSNRYTKTEADAAFGGSTGTSNIVTVGVLNSGSISAGFENIDVGTSTISGGTLSIGSVVTSGATIGHKDDLDLISLSTGHVNVAGTLQATDININGTAVTSTANQLNILNGVTVTKDNINHLLGIDTNIKAALDDTYTQTQVNNIVGAITGNTGLINVGDLISGSITQTFGDINNGSSLITTLGKMSAGELEVDDITINNSSILHSAGANIIFSSGKVNVN